MMNRILPAGHVLLLFCIVLMCGPLPMGDGSGSHTGNPGLVGHLVDGRDGTAADSSIVRLYPVYINKTALTVEKSAAGVPAIDSAQTDRSGFYRFAILDEGIYSIEAEKIDGPDTLFMRRSPVIYSGSKDMGYDTLHRPGSIKGTVTVPGGESPSNITCYIPGTSYLAITDDTGSFRISGIPAGLYSVAFMSDRFNDTTLYNKKVLADSTTDIGPVALVLDRSKNEHDVWGFFDTSSDYRSVGSIEARVTGDSIPADTPRVFPLDWRPDIPGYSGFIYVPAGGLFWTVAIWVYDTLDRRIGVYKVIINRATGDIQVPVFDPRNAVPVVSLRDTAVSINDTIRLSPQITMPADDSVISMEWSINDPGTFSLTPDKDTAFAAPVAPGLVSCIFRVTDRFGNTVSDTSVDTVQTDPPVFSLGHDTIVNTGSSLVFSLDVRQRFGSIESYTWSYAGDTAWTDSGNLPSVSFFFGNPGEQKILCSVRDDDGNVARDTVTVTVVTEIDGILSSDLTLKESSSPYRVKTYLAVLAGSTLTIEPGVRLIGCINIYGTLDAQGTETEKITLSFPMGIKLFKNAVCRLKYCDVPESGAIYCSVADSASAFIMDSCRLTRVWIFSQQNSAGRIRGCTFNSGAVHLIGNSWIVEGNQMDIIAYACGVDWPGLKVQGSNATIASNVISGSGILWRAGSGGTIAGNTVSGGGYIHCDTGVDTIAGNAVQNSSNVGILCGATRVIAGNTVTNSYSSGITGSGNGQTIKNNTVTGCFGHGIYTDGDSCAVRHNTASGNGYGMAPWEPPYFNAGIVCMNPSCMVDSNLITSNANGAICRSGSSLVNNNIYNNRDHDFRVMFGDSSDVDVSNNWWGTTDTAAIRLTIYDQDDDAALGRALIDPVAADSIPGAGAR